MSLELEQEITPENEFHYDPSELLIKRRLSLVLKGFACMILVLVIILVLFFGTQDTGAPPRHIGGYAISTVITGSMYPEMPIDTVFVTRAVSGADIEIGDIITFIRTDRRTITHRVIGIYPNYSGTGRYGFRTQGDAVPTADPEIVHEQNIVGRVIWTSSFFGGFITFIQDNPVIAFGGTGIVVIGIIVLAVKNKATDA